MFKILLKLFKNLFYFEAASVIVESCHKIHYPLGKKSELGYIIPNEQTTNTGTVGWVSLKNPLHKLKGIFKRIVLKNPLIVDFNNNQYFDTKHKYYKPIELIIQVFNWHKSDDTCQESLCFQKHIKHKTSMSKTDGIILKNILLKGVKYKSMYAFFNSTQSKIISQTPKPLKIVQGKIKKS